MFKQRKFVSAFIPVLFFAVVAILLLRSSATQHSGAAVASSALPVNPIIEENQKPGTEAWKSARFDSYFKELTIAEQLEHAQELGLPTSASDAGGGMMQGAWTNSRDVTGYANKTSVNVGGQISFHITSKYSQYEMTIYRMGWYNGNGGTEVVAQQVLPGTNYPVPAPDSLGMVAANWPAAYTLNIPTNWTSGFYLVWLEAVGRNNTSYIPFIVRNDSQQADILYLVATSTWQAYNDWGGKSLCEYNSPGGRARRSL
ncbi:MAG: DUF6605 domain-containing protein [Anaerolineae bacterium]